MKRNAPFVVSLWILTHLFPLLAHRLLRTLPPTFLAPPTISHHPIQPTVIELEPTRQQTVEILASGINPRSSPIG
jgi:hypothetical protein